MERMDKKAAYGSLLCLAVILLVLPNFAFGSTCFFTNSQPTGAARCNSLEGCLWYPETSECRLSPFCSASWDEDLCGSIRYSGACEFRNGVCQLRETPGPVINEGQSCFTQCKPSDVGDDNLNVQCDFCGAQGFCCDIESPGACIPHEPTESEPSVCNLDEFSHCCAPAAPITSSPTSVAPTTAPTSICTVFDFERGCLLSDCIWNGENICYPSGYCDSSWTQSTCELPLNFGSCMYVNGECVNRPEPLGTINEGLDCGYNSTRCAANQPCSLCGTEGICCNPDNPVNCTPNLSVCEPGKLCCARPGTWAPTFSPTRKPTGNPSGAPSSSPTTSKPTRSPSRSPSKSPSSSTPSTSPSSSPSPPPTLLPTSDAPSLSPTRTPTVFGSVVELVSTTGKFEPDVHGSQGFSDFLCDIFTRYWFPTESGCNRSRINIRIDPHPANGMRRRLDTAVPDPDIDVTFSMISIPENSSAVAIGHLKSNQELKKRSATLQYKILYVDPSAIQTEPPSGTDDATTSNGLSQQSWMYIGIGIALFGLFVLLAVLLLVRRRRRSDSESNPGSATTGYQSRTAGYPPSHAYRRKDMYIPQQPRDVLVVRGSDFRTVPPTSKDYVAEEVGNIFSVSQREVAYKPQEDDEDFVARPPARAKSFNRSASQKSYRSDADEGRKSIVVRRDSHRSQASFRSNRSSPNEDSDPMEYRSREDTLYKHQMAPYFSGRLDDEETESVSTMAPVLRSARPSQYSQTSEGRSRGDLNNSSANSGPNSNMDVFVQENVGRNGMSDWM